MAERFRTGETEEEYKTLYENVWEAYLEAQASRDFFVLMVKRRKIEDSLLKFFIFLAGGGALISALKSCPGALVGLAIITAALSALSSGLQFGLEKQKFQVALDSQCDLVDAWKELWSQVRDYGYAQYDEVKSTYASLKQRGNQIYCRVSDSEPGVKLATKLYAGVYRRMGCHNEAQGKCATASTAPAAPTPKASS